MSRVEMWVVEGFTGSHDYIEVWPACVFACRLEAEKCCHHLNCLAAELGVSGSLRELTFSDRAKLIDHAEERIQKDPNGDPGCRISRSGVTWTVTAVPGDLTGAHL